LQSKISSRWRKSYKFILVGCGRIGHSYATVIDNHPEMELAAVLDVNEEAASAFGSSFRCSVHTSLDDFFASGKSVDCAVICTPSSDHADIACQLMQKGMNVLCEQPFALNSASAEKMIDVSHAYGAQLLMGSRLRFVADIIHTRGLIQAGILGKVLVFEGDFRKLIDMRNRWNIQREISGGGVLVDSGHLAVDMASYLFGHLLGVRADEGPRVQSTEVEDTVRLGIQTISGILGTVHLSWNLKNTGDDYFRIYGTQGNLCIGWKKSMYKPNGAQDWINFGEGYDTLRALKRQMAHFIDVVAGEDTPEVSEGDILESVRTIEAAYQSLRTGQFVNIHPATSLKGSTLGARKFSVLRSGKVPTSA
jgi:UDP-N-acetylglucosamine 3-dehydrogenase